MLFPFGFVHLSFDEWIKFGVASYVGVWSILIAFLIDRSIFQSLHPPLWGMRGEM